MPQIRCPVLGCGKRKDEWGGRKDGYPLPSLDAFTLLLSPNVTIDTNTRICTNCYNIHRRPNADLRGRTRITPLPPLNPLLGLLAAATSSPAQPSAAPSSPSFSTSPPPPLPLPPPPPPPLPPPSSAPCPLSDITNAPRRQRRHDTPLKRKRELAEAAAALDAAVHFSLSFALILLSCPHFSPSSLLIPFFYHLPPVVRRPHSAVSCSSAWEAPATWMQRKVSASCRAGASSRPCHLPPVIHCFKHGITLRSDRTYSCLRSLRHVGIGHSHQSLLLGRSRIGYASRAVMMAAALPPTPTVPDCPPPPSPELSRRRCRCAHTSPHAQRTPPRMGNAGSSTPSQSGHTPTSTPTSTHRTSTAASPRTPIQPPLHPSAPTSPLPPIPPSGPSIQTIGLPPLPSTPTRPTYLPFNHTPHLPLTDDDAKRSATSPTPSRYDPDADVQTLKPVPTGPSDVDALPLTTPLLASLDPPPAVSADGSVTEQLLPIERVDGRVLGELLRLCRAHFASDVVEALVEQRRIASALDRLDVDYAEAVEEMRRKREEMSALLQEVAHLSELHASLQRLNSDVHAAIATAHWLSETITRHQRSDDLTPTTPTPQTAAAGDG